MRRRVSPHRFEFTPGLLPTPWKPITMPTFFYRCPNTGLKVQGWVADDPTKDEAFEPVTCTACARVHLIDSKTGKIAGTDK
jgi:hypothetical protein